jgi:hypothetical protein
MLSLMNWWTFKKSPGKNNPLVIRKSVIRKSDLIYLKYSTVPSNLHFLAWIHEIFFYRNRRQTTLKIALYGLFHKKSLGEVTWIVLCMFLCTLRKICCEKVHERLFLALFAVYTGKKKDFVKNCEILWIHTFSREFTRIHAIFIVFLFIFYR